MENVIIKIPEGNPAQRSSAIPIRDKVIAAFENSETDKILLDLSGVDTVSGSFADECVGIMVNIFGTEKVKSKIRLINGNPAANKSIAKAILDRIELAAQQKDTQ